MGHNQMAGSKCLYRDNYFNACMVLVSIGRSIPVGWGGVWFLLVNSLSVAQ